MAFDPITAEDDYIDMEVGSYSNFFCNSIVPSPREFEFQMSSTPKERDYSTMTTSPADELFYKGKLLPLHLPPRLQMVEKLLLQNSKPNFISSFDHMMSQEESLFGCGDEFYSTPLMTTAPTPTATSTPFESCNISPSESFRMINDSTEEEYMMMNKCYSTELSDFTNGGLNNGSKKSWGKAKKLKNSSSSSSSSLGSKLKASKAYLKSWFGKSGCSNESSTASKDIAEKRSVVSFGQTEKEKKAKISNTDQVDGGGRHRRSFSLAFLRYSTYKSSSSSSSSSSSASSTSSSSSGSSSFSSSNICNNQELKQLKRCGSVKHSEIENSIQGAIAHCKQSQFHSRNTVNVDKVGLCEEHDTVPEGLSRG